MPALYSMAFRLSSTAFEEGKPIPQKFTCQGSDVSPPFAWTGAPANTKVFAFVLDDPDAPAGTWNHWAFWNLPKEVTSLPEGADVTRYGAVIGTTSIGATGYHGPCPPSGSHRYVATLYALSQPLTLPEGSPLPRLRSALMGRVLGEAKLTGTYQKT